MKKILLIDNDAMFTGMVNCILENEKLDVFVACDGKEAEAALSSSQYDLVIADMFIPYSNGFEILHKIRTDKSNPQTPVMVVSEVQNEQSIANCFRLGADAYLTKPVNMALFMSEIRSMLSTRKNAAA